jgi:hypothetical protein
MATVRTTPRKVVGQIKRGNRQTLRAIVRGSNVAAARLRPLLARATPTDTGQAKSSWTVRRSTIERVGIIRRTFELASVESDAPHMGILERGARPHWLSPEAMEMLYEWVRRHFRLVGRRDQRRAVSGRELKAQKKRGRRVKGGAFEDPLLTEITWAIARNIAEQGQEPRYFVRALLPKARDLMGAEIDRRVAKVAGRGGR